MSFEEVNLFLENGVRTIVLNRPSKKNCLNHEMYVKITDTLNADAKNDGVVLTIITGSGDYFCSGNDFLSGQNANTEDVVEYGAAAVEGMISAFINYTKILVAVVNGPAIGIGTTMPALCDIIYASETSTFELPFVRLGLNLEGCSSFLLPAILGKSKTSEMLFFNHVLTAKEAYDFKFVSRIIPRNEIKDFIRKLHKFGSLPLRPVIRNKKLLKMHMTKILEEANKVEMKGVRECMHSEEFFNAVIEFMSRKSKL